MSVPGIETEFRQSVSVQPVGWELRNKARTRSIRTCCVNASLMDSHGLKLAISLLAIDKLVWRERASGQPMDVQSKGQLVEKANQIADPERELKHKFRATVVSLYEVSEHEWSDEQKDTSR